MFSWETLHSSAVGGVATHVTELAAALARRGHQVQRLHQTGSRYGQRASGRRRLLPLLSARPRSQFRRRNHGHVSLARLAFLRNGEASRALRDRALTRLARPMRRAGSNSNGPICAPCSPCTPPSTGRCGNSFWDGPSTRIRECEWEGTYAVDRVIAVSSMLKEELSRVYSLPAWKCDVIHNGVPVHEFDGAIDPGRVKQSYGLGALDPTVLFCGRLCLQKGPDLLLEAIPGLLGHHESAKFLFVGDGHMLWDLRERAQHLGGQSRDPLSGPRERRAAHRSVQGLRRGVHAPVATSRSASWRSKAGQRASR